MQEFHRIEDEVAELITNFNSEESQADVRTTGQSYFDGPPTNSATSIPKLSWSPFSPGYAGFSP